MISYVLGFIVPFIIMTFFIGKISWIRKHNVMILKVGGSLMVLVGFMLFFDWMNIFISWLTVLFGGFQGF
jgi:cytochrome c-type biogenesis protein